MTARNDVEACRAWIREHSRSFYLSSLLLPARVRRASWVLYAFCRRADDAVDEAADGALRRVDDLRRRLEHVYAGGADDQPIDRAFAALVEAVRLPRALPEALLAGMEMDARAAPDGLFYDSEDELLLYCFRVAATVGLMMTVVMGASDDVAWLRAADLGVAMQLTNIARDVGEDARRRRVYLPRSLCAEVGLDPRTLFAATRADEPTRAAVRRLLARADQHYAAADHGVRLLPRRCRWAIRAARLIYARIGGAIAANGYDSVAQRAYVSTATKLALVARAWPATLSWTHPADLTAAGPADATLTPLLASVGLGGQDLPHQLSGISGHSDGRT